jgi:hypothetical protein
LLKSIDAIPKFLNSRWGSFIKVITLDGVVLPEVSMVQDSYSEYSLLPKKKFGWFFHNNHLYVLYDTNLVKVLLNGLFDDPVQIEQLNCQNVNPGSACTDYLDEEFPIDVDLVDGMYKIVLDVMTKLLNVPKDNETNNLDTTNGS